MPPGYDLDNNLINVTTSTIKENKVSNQTHHQQINNNFINNNNNNNNCDNGVKSLVKTNESGQCVIKNFHNGTEDDKNSEKNVNNNCRVIEKVNNNGKSINARQRWKILARAISHNNSISSSSSSTSSSAPPSPSSSSEEDELIASVRRFGSFDLIRHETIPKAAKENLMGTPENWSTYRIISGQNQEEYSVNIHHVNKKLTAIDLIGFNNTGNICVWPSEEALCYYVLSDIKKFENSRILELGGGMTCLAGLIIAKYGNPYAVHLTDGNPVSVENVKRTLKLNDINCYVKCSVLKWEQTLLNRRSLSFLFASEVEKFDYILSADCLFFDEARSALVNTIWYFLSHTGIALIMAPRRGKTTEQFLRESIDKGFQYRVFHRYNETIWQKHLELKKSNLYDEDIHYPILIQLTKSCYNNNSK